MENIMLYMGILVVMGFIYMILNQKLTPVINYREAYQARPLLTKREHQEYLKLKQYADDRGWLVCPKVRLWDLIEPKKRKGNRKELENKIRSKHVDFVIVDPELNVIGVLELDDSTHDREDRKKRDSFVRNALEGAGITMIQTRSITSETLNSFQKNG